MKALLIVAGIVLANFAIPYGAWGYGAHYLSITEREFLKRYGLISISRAISAVLVFLTVVAGWLWSKDQAWLYSACLVFVVLFCASAIFDVWRAMTGSWIVGKNGDGRVA